MMLGYLFARNVATKTSSTLAGNNSMYDKIQLMENQRKEREEKGKKIMKVGCLSFIIIVAIAVLIGVLTDDGLPSTSAAYVVSKEFVRTQVDFPEEAEFPVMPVLSEIQEGTDTLYRVVGDVTVKNVFGVKSKHRYIMRLKFKGGDELNPNNWEVVDFSL